MNRCLIALAATAAMFASTAQAATFGETFDPAKFTLNEAADGTTSGTYNGNAVDTVLLLGGASASSKTLGTHILSDLCGSNVAVLWSPASGSTAAGANYRAYACDTKAGNPLTNAVGSLVIVKRDQGGSKQGVDPILVPNRIDMLRVGGFNSLATPANNAANTCVATGNAPSLNVPSYLCADVSNVYPDAGLSDVEPAIINASVNGGSSLTASGVVTQKSIFQQLIATAVNLKLYRALQQAQGLTQDDAEANRPSLPSSFIGSAVLGKLSPGGKRGWELVVPATVDAAANTRQINVCRRTNGSGTQAAANIFFGNAPCSPNGVAPKATTGSSPAIQAIGTGTAVSEGGSTGAVEGCLTNVDNLATTAYAVGHIGRDNDPLAGGVDKKYRFVKIDGNQPEAHPDGTSGKCDGTRNFAGCNDAQTGKYSYIYESTMQWNNTTPGNGSKAALLNNLATKGFTSAQLLGNNAAVVAGVMALPTYSGLYNNLALGSADQVYGSRVTRGGSSCSPIYLAK